MGKKHDAKTVEQAAKKAAKAAKEAAKEVKEKAKAGAAKVEAAIEKAAPKKGLAKPAPARPKSAVAPHPTNEEVALRAYYVSEKREAEGLPGNTDSDWIEAERQLRLEAASSPAKPKAAAKRLPAPAKKPITAAASKRKR